MLRWTAGDTAGHSHEVRDRGEPSFSPSHILRTPPALGRERRHCKKTPQPPHCMVCAVRCTRHRRGSRVTPPPAFPSRRYDTQPAALQSMPNALVEPVGSSVGGDAVKVDGACEGGEDGEASRHGADARSPASVVRKSTHASLAGSVFTSIRLPPLFPSLSLAPLLSTPNLATNLRTLRGWRA